MTGIPDQVPVTRLRRPRHVPGQQGLRRLRAKVAPDTVHRSFPGVGTWKLPGAAAEA